MLPSVSRTSLTVNASACRSQTAACQLPIPDMWTASGAYAYSGGLRTQSDLIDGAAWDPDYASLLSLDGSGRHIQQRMTMYHGESTANPAYLDYHTMSVSEDYSVSYSPDTGYTMNVGFVSTLDTAGLSLAFKRSCYAAHISRLTKTSSRYMALKTH